MDAIKGMRLGMVVDLSRCIGCNACAVACKMENAVPEGCFNTWVESWDAGVYPDVTRANVPKLCNHCADAPCVGVCPTGASYIGENGNVMIDEERCIGCKYCMAACPYQVRWQRPDSATVEKCTFCDQRSSMGLLPACVSMCPTHARVFGDTSDPESEVSQLLASQKMEQLRDELGLEVSVHYIGLEETMNAPVSSGVCHGGALVKNPA